MGWGQRGPARAGTLSGSELTRPPVFPGQSLELYRFLKIRGQAPVRLILYPGEGHGNLRAASRLDYNLRMLQWFAHYLQGPGGPPPASEIDYEPGKPASPAKP